MKITLTRAFVVLTAAVLIGRMSWAQQEEAPPPQADVQDESAAAPSGEEFQEQGDLFYNQTSYDDDSSVTMFGLQGMYGFRPVSTAGNPIREAQYLERVPYAGLMVGQTELDPGSGGSKSSGLGFGVMGSYSDPAHPWAADLSFVAQNLEDDDGTLKINSNVVSLRPGYFCTPTGLVGISFELNNLSVESGGSTTDSTTTNIGLFGKYVHELKPGQQWVEAEGSFEQSTWSSDGFDDEINNVLSLAATYYFLPNAGAGVSIENNSGDDKSSEGNTVGVSVSYDHGAVVGVSVEYETFSPSDDAYDGSDTISVNVTGRL